MIVKPYFAQSQDACTRSQKAGNYTLSHLIEKPRIVRMNSNGSENVLILFRNFDCSLQASTVRVARPHVQNSNDADGARTRHDLIAVCVVFLPINVRV